MRTPIIAAFLLVVSGCAKQPDAFDTKLQRIAEETRALSQLIGRSGSAADVQAKCVLISSMITRLPSDTPNDERAAEARRLSNAIENDVLQVIICLQQMRREDFGHVAGKAPSALATLSECAARMKTDADAIDATIRAQVSASGAP